MGFISEWVTSIFTFPHNVFKGFLTQGHENLNPLPDDKF